MGTSRVLKEEVSCSNLSFVEHLWLLWEETGKEAVAESRAELMSYAAREKGLDARLMAGIPPPKWQPPPPPPRPDTLQLVRPLWFL